MKGIKDIFTEKGFFIKIMVFLVGVFIIAINYNLFVRPNSFVLGGASGISILCNAAFGFDPVITLYILNVMFLILAGIFLGKKETIKAIAGSILYPVFVSLTIPLANLLLPYLNFNNYLIVVLICGCLHGLGTGLIYRCGYNTGGGDILTKMTTKFIQIPEGNAMLICNIIIQTFSVIIFGINKVIYSVIIILITSTLVNKILIGISDSKMFFIYSKKYKDIEKFIIEDLNTGVTVFNTEGAFFKKKRKMLMVVVPTRDYYRVKDTVLKIDEEAFFVVSDCYEVDGGIKRKNLPFI